MYRRSTAKVIHVSEDLYTVKIKIPLSYKNRNYVGSIFGGSMLSATDPIYMVQLINILGDAYVIWDKAVEAQYKKPAKSAVYGNFEFLENELEDIKKRVALHNEIDLFKTVNLIDAEGHIIATFKKTIYIANKSYYKEKLNKRTLNT